MRQRLGLLALTFAILLVGCGKDRPRHRHVPADEGAAREVVRKDPVAPSTGTATTPAAAPGTTTELPPPGAPQLYEQALLEAVDHLAERKYKDALAALEKAKGYQDTEAVRAEIDKVRAVLEQEAAAERAVQDVKAVLDDGKADEAAKLAGAALSQYGGGDRADDLSKLKQEAEAVVTAAQDDTATRRAALKAEADAALRDNNLRAAAVALEQAVALGDDGDLRGRLGDLRGKLDTYDDNRTRAIEMRRDPSRVEQALTRLQEAQRVWDTLQVRQEIDECRLILERRRDRLSVADFEVIDDVGQAGAGRIVAGELLPHFRPRFDLVERAQVNRVLSELNLAAAELGDSARGREALGQMARLRYLVVGSLSSLGGVTLQARLVEVPTGLIVQTARVTAPSVEALVPKLKQAALMLQMNDEQKLAYEASLLKTVTVIKPIDAAPLTQLPPPPPPPAPAAPPPAAVVTYTPQPIPVGALVVEDMRRPPPVIVAPQPLAVVLAQDDPRRHRLFRLSIELGDNCFRRGLFREAQRHFSLAFSIGGPRRELSLRLDACRGFVPPPPPPPPVVVAPPPVTVLTPPAVVVAPQPVVVVRPRVAVFGFVPSRPTLVPPAETELLAEQFASYCRGSHEVIDRGEVCWYMGRLNLTLADVLRDPVSRRCLAQALHASYFVYGSIVETASFNVETHLVDAETGARAGTGTVHVQNTQELKLRLSELARQMGAKPAEQAALAKKGAASEKALNEARALLMKQPAKAAEIARAALKDNPDSTALQALRVEAERRERLAKVEAERRAAEATHAKALADARAKREALAKQAAQAKAKAEADAAARDATARKQQQEQREKAAAALRAQAKESQAKGQYALAMQQLQSAAKLRPGPDLDRELAQATIAADKAIRDKALAEQKKRDEALKAQQQAAAKRVQDERLAREKAEAERHKAEEARQQALHDNFLKQAKAEMAKKDFAKALAAAESARRVRATDESLKLVNDARHEIEVGKAKDADRAKLEAERKAREEAERKVQADRSAYLAAMKKAQDALVAKRYDEAAAQYQAASKLFATEAAKSGLKTATDLREQEKKHVAEEARAKEDAAKRTARMKEKIDEGKRLMAQKQYAKAADAYREAVKAAPANVDALAGLKEAERARDEEIGRRNVALRSVAAGKASLGKKEYAEAAKAFRAALSLEPENAEAKRLLAEAEKMLAAKPPAPAVDLKMKEREAAYGAAMQRGGEALKAKRYADAERAYDDALKQKPGDAAAIKGKRDAVELAKQPAPPPPVDPRKAAYQKAMGEAKALAGQKKYAEAIKAYDAALAQMPKDPAATKERADAARLLAEAAKPKMPPPPPPATSAKDKQKEEDYKLALSAGRAALKNKNYLGAVNAYNEALRLLPGDKAATAERAEAMKGRDALYDAWVKKGQEAMKAKKYADAAKAYDEALKLKPGDAAAVKGKKEADAAAKKP
jgi:tetratricopeptide (TPR) repeat protein